MKKILIGALIIQLLVIVCYFYFVYLLYSTDNFGAFIHYGAYAGIAIYSAIGIWLITLAVVAKNKSFTTLHGKFAILLPPVTAMAGWLLVWPS